MLCGKNWNHSIVLIVMSSVRVAISNTVMSRVLSINVLIIIPIQVGCLHPVNR